MRILPLAAMQCLGLGLAAVSANASGGVLEINQACAAAPGTGCFPGDVAGFPVTLSQSGSYRLTGHLVVPADTSALRIEADGVTVDLNGFAVRGPFVCAPLPCFVGAGSGVESAPALGNRVSISNGEISGFGLDGVNLRSDAHVERLLVTSAGRHGIVIGSGSIALANRIRTVGDNGLRMVDTGGLGAPIYRDNVITEANQAGAGATAVSGGRATGGNGCSDGSCSQRGARRFYLTTTGRDGAHALNACTAGFHMASFWELRDTSGLEYDRSRGYSAFDAGHGPPVVSGWARTGTPGSGSFAPAPGQATCSAWTSALATEYGTYVSLDFNWATQPLSVIDPWFAGAAICSNAIRVWCVED